MSTIQEYIEARRKELKHPEKCSLDSTLKEFETALGYLEQLQAKLAHVTPLNNPHEMMGSSDCPTWYDGCHCTVETLTHNIDRSEKAEAELNALGGKLVSEGLPERNGQYLIDIGYIRIEAKFEENQFYMMRTKHYPGSFPLYICNVPLREIIQWTYFNLPESEPQATVQESE